MITKITEAIHIAQTQQLSHLVTKAQQLQTQIRSQLEAWQILLDKNVSIARCFEKTEMEEYLKAAMRIKYSKD
ncbi:MAG: hypothetical protein ACXADY_18195 [Candidatus Hodarchaeales archaeon]